MIEPATEPATEPDGQKRTLQLGLGLGAVGIIGTVVGAVVDYQVFVKSYLFALVFWVAISLGALLLLMIHHLVGGRWGAILKRPLEAASLCLPLMALFFLPVLLSLEQLYPWANETLVHAHEELEHKRPYLNEAFFIVRTLLYFAVWTALAVALRRNSLRADEAVDPRPFGRRLTALSAGGLVVVGLTNTFALIDWTQSLRPLWNSSMYPLMLICGELLSAVTVVVLTAILLARRHPLDKLVDAERLNDLGNLTLVFVALWGYTHFFQFLIIWMGDTRSSIQWYLARTRGGWETWIIFVVIVQLVVPVLLLFRKIKRTRALFVALLVGLLLARVAHVYWLVIPAFHPETFWLSWQPLATWLAVGGCWMALFMWLIGRQPLIGRSSRALFARAEQSEKGAQQ